MKRRDMLVSTGAAVLSLSAVPFRQAAAAEAEAHAGKTHYIDPVAGDDAADGLTPARAWKTCASRGFSAGDTVLFKRGSVFRGVLHTRNGTDQAPITYGAYGEGDKPAFLGSVPADEPEHWVQERPSVWRYTGTFPNEVCNVVCNNGESCGILRWRIEDLQQPGDWHYTGIGMHSADGRRGDPDGVLYCYWQTTGELLMQFTRLCEGKTTAEAIETSFSTGEPWPLDLWRSCPPSEFPRYQAESGQDRHSRVAQPLFVDEAGGDYRQRADSPCLGAGMRGDRR